MKMDFKMYKKLVRIRELMDENPTKAKQLLTDIVKKYEKENFGGEIELLESTDIPI